MASNVPYVHNYCINQRGSSSVQTLSFFLLLFVKFVRWLDFCGWWISTMFMFHCNGAAATTYDGSIVVHELLAITLRVVAIQAKTVKQRLYFYLFLSSCWQEGARPRAHNYFRKFAMIIF